MSKIEKALNRAQEEIENQQTPDVIPASESNEMPLAGTALVVNRSGLAVSRESIARMREDESQLLSEDERSQRDIINPNPDRANNTVVQMFRELRSKIIQQGQGRNGVILVTSVTQGSGSSFVAQNLGAAFAFDPGKTTLLIDCNLKNPCVHRLIGNSTAPGLTDYLENMDVDIAEIIHPVGISRYRAIPAGGQREIPLEHFTSPKMWHLIESVRRRYDERFVILDGPPMSDIADIRVLSELSDFVIVVARYGRATNSQIENCLNAINPGKLLGVVFNDEPRIPWFG